MQGNKEKALIRWKCEEFKRRWLLNGIRISKNQNLRKKGIVAELIKGRKELERVVKLTTAI